MVKGIKLALVLFVVAGVVGVVVPAFSQEKAEQPAVTSVSGEVVSVDLVNSTVVIKQIKDPVVGTYENQTISVLPETKITKGDATLKLSELTAGDKVTVKYATDVMGKQKVESITIEVQKIAPVK